MNTADNLVLNIVQILLKLCQNTGSRNDRIHQKSSFCAWFILNEICVNACRRFLLLCSHCSVVFAAIPNLKCIQNKVYRAKKKNVAGVKLETRLELIHFCRNLSLPSEDICRQISSNPSANDVKSLMSQKYIYVPQNGFKVDGACFTGPRQIRWMQQLLDKDDHFVLHMDGKFKLHHGVWMLITLGTHCLREIGTTKASGLCTTFVPLIYLFCKDHETTAACAMLSAALTLVTVRCFGKKLQPGALMSDHSDGIRSGMLSEWPRVPHGQCWPHIRRKLGEGAFCSKKHPLYEVLPDHFTAIHLAQSPQMRELLLREIGKQWDALPEKWNLRSFWNEYCVEPWNNWSLCSFDCMLCTPSQQAQESWHRSILQSKIPGMFKGSTEHVMQVSLPELIDMDATYIPDNLLFHVSRVPQKILDQAMCYVPYQTRCIHVQTENVAPNEVFTFFILREKPFDYRLIVKYQSMLKGVMPTRSNKLSKLIDILFSVHVVQFDKDVPGRRAVPCDLNPACLVCSCKYSRNVGICAHILLINHWLGNIKLEELCGSLVGEKRKRGGFNKGTRPALSREDSTRSTSHKSTNTTAVTPPASSLLTADSSLANARLSATDPTDPLQILLRDRRERIAEEARIRERVEREMSAVMDTGIRVNRALQEGFQGA